MKAALLAVSALAAFSGVLAAGEKGMTALDFKMKGIDGKEADLSQYKGKVVLFVNVASQCGFTSQYTGLQELYASYGKDGLVVVGVPSNDFGKQEPDGDKEIREFCTANYKVTFPMLSKVVVKGDDKVDLYKYLVANGGDKKEVGWNFEKFLVNRKGEVVDRFKSGVDPKSDELVDAIKAELKK